MRKKIPAHNPLLRKLYPPVRLKRDHVFLENASEHPFVARPPGTSGHSPLHAWWLAELSLLAYDKPEVVESVLEAAGLRLRMPLSKGGTQGFVAEGDDFVIVAFRGTELPVPALNPLKTLRTLRGSLMDSLTDARFGLAEVPGLGRGRVHGGFLAALNEVFDQLRDLAGPGRALWLTGHSMGGALAILAAAQLPNVQGIYTFGTPSVGDADFGAALQERVRLFRFVHGDDWVTRLLASSSIFGEFETEGTIVGFDREGRLRTGDAPSNGITDRFKSFLLDQLPTSDLLDHSPLFYALHLWNLFDSTLT